MSENESDINLRSDECVKCHENLSQDDLTYRTQSEEKNNKNVVKTKETEDFDREKFYSLFDFPEDLRLFLLKPVEETPFSDII